ncbi:MAG: hypothetical protein JXL81_11120, partial [Deltaproteobacteria bacterium]|nr:hypothetical protein [Deltaproteobacteria bacterium]
MRRLKKIKIIMGFSVIYMIMTLLSCSSDLKEDLEDLEDDIETFLQEPNTEPIRAAIKTSVPLGNISAISMAVYNGQEIDGVSISRSGSLAVINFEKYPPESESLPFSYGQAGSVTVYGWWSSPERAILTVVFTDYSPGVPSFSVKKINTFPVQALDAPYPHIMLVCSNLDIDISTGSNPEDPGELNSSEQSLEFERFLNIGFEDATRENAEINLDIDSWVIRITDSGTPLDFFDDVYNISGGGQYIDVTVDGEDAATGVYQLGLAGVSVSPDCSSNPLAGFAVIQEIGIGGEEALVAAQAVLTFENKCDAS